MRPFAARLLSGQPVTVLALGSSIVQDNAGVFHSSLEAVQRAVPVPNFALYEPGKRPGQRVGWAQQFMEYVNATWPHRDHLFINGGARSRSRRIARVQALFLCRRHASFLGTDACAASPLPQAAPASTSAASPAACAWSRGCRSARTSS